MKIAVSGNHTSAMSKLMFAIALLCPAVARADGWIHCSGPDSNCNAAGGGVGLIMIAAVTYMLGRRRRR